MPELGGIKISVEVGGQALEEYQVQKKGENAIECHIVSVPGQAFAVNVEDNSPHSNPEKLILSRALISLDGVPDVSGWMTAKVWKDVSTGEYRAARRRLVITGSQISQTFNRPFIFARVELTEHGKPQAPDETSKVGTIGVDVVFNRVTGESPYAPQATDKSTVSLSERSKKGGGHCSTLGEPVSKNLGRSVTTSDCPDLPKYSFLFHHASKDWLQAKEIIDPPRRPQQEPEIKQDPEPIAGPSQHRKRKRVVKTEKGGPEFIDLLSDTEYLDEDDDIEAFRRMQAKIAKRKQASRPVKQEPGSMPQSVIDISD